MSTISAARMSARDYFTLGEDGDGPRLELVDGVVVVSPSPIPAHSHTDSALRAILFPHIRRHKLGRLFGDLDTLLGPDDVRRPDILFISRLRPRIVNDRVTGPPDLCVEIISPGTEKTDRVDKFRQYARFGVPHYWIIDPTARAAEAFVLRGDRYEPNGSGREADQVRFAPFNDLPIDLSDLWMPVD